MTSRKLDELASDLDDLSITVEELKEDRQGGIDQRKLDVVERALNQATDAVDDIENDDESPGICSRSDEALQRAQEVHQLVM